MSVFRAAAMCKCMHEMPYVVYVMNWHGARVRVHAHLCARCCTLCHFSLAAAASRASSESTTAAARLTAALAAALAPAVVPPALMRRPCRAWKLLMTVSDLQSQGITITGWGRVPHRLHQLPPGHRGVQLGG